MPTYSAVCKTCSKEQDYIAKVDDRNITPTCCKASMERVLVAPMVSAMGIADNTQLVSPIDGRTLYGRSEYYAHMKKHNVVPASDVQGEAEHQKKQTAVKVKAKRKEAIAKTIQKLGG
jgi:hypothetical protein